MAHAESQELASLCGSVGRDLVYHACGHDQVPTEVKFF